MRLIDADELYSFVKAGEMNEYLDFGEGYNGGIAFALKRIEIAPTVDAVPVVKCKDCKHWDSTNKIGWCNINSQIDADGIWLAWNENDFCIYGERKTE